MNQPLAVHFDKTQVSIKRPDDNRIRSVDCLSPTSIGRNSESSVSINATTTPNSSDSSQLSNRSRVISPELQSFVNSSPVIIGDRVVVGSNKLVGTVAYIGPTHFSTESLAGVVLDEAKGKHDGTSHGIRYFQCPPNRGMLCRLSHLKKLDEGSQAKNVRIRTQTKQQPASFAQANGLDNRRFSITKANGMVRSCSARFSRNAIISVIGAVSPKSSHSTSGSGFKRTQSERFRTKRPQWIPPGSHDLNSNGAVTDGRMVTERGRPASSRDLIVTDRRTERRPHTIPRTLISEFLTQKHSAQNKGVSKESDMLRPNGFMRSNDLLEAYANSLIDFSWTDCAYSKSRPKNEDEEDRLQVDNVISCAQDRLLQLQNQLLEVYRAKSRVSNELEEQRRLYRKLSELYESRTSKGVLTEKSRVDNVRVGKIRSELNLEFERTKHIWTELRKLNVELEKSCRMEPQINSNDSPSGTEIVSRVPCPSIGQSVTARLPSPSLPENPHEERRLCMDEFPNFLLRSSTRVTQNDQYNQLLCLTSQRQERLNQLLQSINTCRQNLQSQIDDIRKQQINLESAPLIPTLQLVVEMQNKELADTQCVNRRLTIEYSVIKAEIAHLSSRPLFEAKFLLEKFRNAKKLSHNAQCRIQTLMQTNQRLKEDLTAIKAQSEASDLQQTNFLRFNLRIHQLQQFECKARGLHQEQCELITKKTDELNSAVDELNFMSQLWANERQLKSHTNLQLKQKLTKMEAQKRSRKVKCKEMLNSDSSWLRSSADRAPLKVTDWSNFTGTPPSRLSKSKGAQGTTSGVPQNSGPSLTYTLFNALCTEIRRLQTRSASLIDALDSLSSNNCDEDKKNSIRTLVYRTKNLKSYTKIMPYFRRERENQSDLEKHDHLPGIEDRINGILPLCDSTALRVGDKQNSMSQLVRSHTRSNNPPFGTHLRLRPLSFYSRRSCDPVLETTIPEEQEPSS